MGENCDVANSAENLNFTRLDLVKHTMKTIVNSLSSIGTGLELNIKDYPLFFERARVMTRFQFGANVTGWSLGFAASF